MAFISIKQFLGAKDYKKSIHERWLFRGVVAVEVERCGANLVSILKVDDVEFADGLGVGREI